MLIQPPYAQEKTVSQSNVGGSDPTGSLSESSVEVKLGRLRTRLAELDGLIVGFSGGIDSALLLKVAVDSLGDRAVALTAVSASLPDSELQGAKKFAASIGAQHHCISSSEIHNPVYAANPTNRCFYCKAELFRLASSLKRELGFEHVAIGTNTDDLGSHRPGLKAAAQSGVLHPLVEADFSKAEVRAAARMLGLEIWDKPAFACLSSRVPYGTPITVETLTKVGAAETLLRDLGFAVFRVRFHNDLARIEVGADEYAKFLLPDIRSQVAKGIRALGFRFVSIDLEPYRSGRMNEGLASVSNRD